MNQDIEQLMAKVQSVIDLEQIVQQQTGKEFSDYIKYLKWLDSIWERLSAEKRCAVFESILAEAVFPTRSSTGLPTMIVKSEGVEDYLYEENLQGCFDLLYSQELRDVTCTMRESNLFLKSVVAPVGLFLSLALPIVFGAAYIYSKILWKSQQSDEQNIYLSQKALTDERYQVMYADFCSTTEMPQPFNLERSYLSEKGSWSNFLTGSVLLGKMGLATGEERSLWTARSLQRYASSHNLHTLHYLCGGGHTTEIAYFLEHPDFSFERLEEYRLSKK